MTTTKEEKPQKRIRTDEERRRDLQLELAQTNTRIAFKAVKSAIDDGDLSSARKLLGPLDDALASQERVENDEPEERPSEASPGTVVNDGD